MRSFHPPRRRRPALVLVLLSAAAVGAPLPAPAEESQEGEPVVEEGRTVSLEYTLKLDDGTTADSNVGGEPLVYQQGGGQILPALEKELEGMRIEESRQVTLSPEKGYGAVDPELFQEVETSLVPEDARSAGTQLVSEDNAGNRRLIRVHEVREEKTVIDFNHPLAGQTLHFDVKVLSVE